MPGRDQRSDRRGNVEVDDVVSSGRSTWPKKIEATRQAGGGVNGEAPAYEGEYDREYACREQAGAQHAEAPADVRGGSTEGHARSSAWRTLCCRNKAGVR
jgi:hypothetical protein